MDILKAAQTYITKMVSEVSGMKVLLLDSHTVSLVSRIDTDSVDAYSVPCDDTERAIVT